VGTRFEERLHDREAEHPDAGRPIESARDYSYDHQQHDRTTRSCRGENDDGTCERQHRTAATELCEHGPRMADHRNASSYVRNPPRATEQSPNSSSKRAFRSVTNEHRNRRPRSEALAHVPVSGVLVADLARVDVATTADQNGNRNGTEEVTNARRNDDSYSG
jgi:hypothetical protein